MGDLVQQRWQREQTALQNRFGRVIRWTLVIAVSIFLFAYVFQVG